MYIPKLYRHQSIGKIFNYLILKTLFRAYGNFYSFLDRSFWGPSRGFNEYDVLNNYQESHLKPDKQYSILPTVISLTGNTQHKTLLDLGCGTGFFCIPFTSTAKKIYGIDNSQTQLDLAFQHRTITYILDDIFTTIFPKVDIIIASFVINYSPTVPVLRTLLEKMYYALSYGGKIVLVVDLPNYQDLTRFGAKKEFIGPVKDEASFKITLLNHQEEICTLSATYFTQETIETILREIGFQEITWHQPIISEQGIAKLGKKFWEGYIENPELGYITAKRLCP